MMNKLTFMAGATLVAMAISSCSEDTGTIGESLTDESDQFVISTNTFQATTSTIVAGSVLSLSSKSYLGRVKDPETEAEVTSEFTTQFHIMETMSPPDKEYLPKRDEYGHMVADSCDLILYLGSPFKSDDSLTAMKMKVLELDRPVEDNQKLYTDYDPISLGLIRQDGFSKSHVFTYNNLTGNDDAKSLSSVLPNIRIPMNQPYTAKDGAVYSNYASYILNEYYEHPQNFRNSYVFAHNVCPGIFFQITDGLGFHSQITDVGLRMFYNVVKADTSYMSSLVLAGTEEVRQTTKITNDQNVMEKLASETDHTYLKTHAGLFTEVTLPVEEIKNGHENDSLLAAKITFQRINNESADKRLLGIPQNILMVQKDSLKSFFENQKLPDSRTSYYTSYNSTYNTYTFTNISSIISWLYNIRVEGLTQERDSLKACLKENVVVESLKPEYNSVDLTGQISILRELTTNSDYCIDGSTIPQNWTASHPDWNKMVLVPISYKTTSSSTVPTKVEHDMSLTSTRLVGGANKGIDISIVYAKFKE